MANTNDLESPQLLQLQKFCHRRTARTALKYGRQQERAETPGGSKGLRTPFLVTAERMSSSKRHPHMPETPSHPQSPSWFCPPSKQGAVTDKAQTEGKGEWSPAPPPTKGLPSKPAVQNKRSGKLPLSYAKHSCPVPAVYGRQTVIFLFSSQMSLLAKYIIRKTRRPLG